MKKFSKKISLAIIFSLLSICLLVSPSFAALKDCMWVHGNVCELESPNPAAYVKHYGWGTHFKMENQGQWIHIPFTVPVIADGIRPDFINAFIFYRTIGDVKITNLHIYDGPRKVWANDNLSLQGDHLGAIDAYNSWSISARKIYYGLSYCIYVQFGAVKDNQVPELIISTAGADFSE